MFRLADVMEDAVFRGLMIFLICVSATGCSKSSDTTAPPQAKERPNTSPADVAAPLPEAVPRDTARDDAAHEDVEGYGTSAMRSESPPSVRRSKPTKNTITTVRVFYGTDRQRTGNSAPNEFYGGHRGRLAVGFCDVSIPPNHKTGQLEAPSIWRLEFSENPAKHVVLRSVQPVDGSTFLGRLRSAVTNSIQSDSVGGEAFIFVHGYNVTFCDAARRTAQMAHDLDFAGAPVMFSWPSMGKNSMASYREDERTAEWCEEDVLDFVTVIAQKSGARRIHLIAHSMGNRIASGVLRRMAYAYRSSPAPLFNEVILTAPDIDAETFKLSIAPRIERMADRITVYASENDVALKGSEWLHSKGNRLGQGGVYLSAFLKFPKINMVDASGVDTSLFAINHSYYGESPTILNDIANVLAGAGADVRGLKTLIPETAWQVPQRLVRLATRRR